VKNLRVANRYAKALLGLAEENNFSDQAFHDMKLVYEALESSKELQTVLKSPIIRITRKLNILKAIFEGKLHPVSMHYLSIITRKKRASLIMGISYEFLNIHREKLDIEIVTLITAGEIDEELRIKAREIASGLTTKQNIEFNHVYDPAIIGGFVLKIGDLLYDASIKRKLSNIKKHLLEV
jgi:F-type H+-transporting ATPase subunit delta